MINALSWVNAAAPSGARKRLGQSRAPLRAARLNRRTAVPVGWCALLQWMKVSRSGGWLAMKVADCSLVVLMFASVRGFHVVEQESDQAAVVKLGEGSNRHLENNNMFAVVLSRVTYDQLNPGE